MKKWIALPLAAVLLGACTGQGVSLGVGLGGNLGRHVGIGTSINIPLGGIGTKSGQAERKDAEWQSGKIVSHFDAQGNASDAAVKGGYYRELIKVQPNGEYLVQDFYSDGSKRSDPMGLNREQLSVFRAQPANGTYTVYAINGTIMQQQNFRNGKAVFIGN